MKKKISIIAVVGATATGKSDFAVQLAKKLDGEVISADSRQVYKGLNLGTGKITKKEMRGIPHHLLDVVDPSKKFNVEEYKNLAQEAIADISSRGKMPIICGGTGFYIDAIVKNISYPDVPHDKVLQKKLDTKTVEQVFSLLKKLDGKFALSLNNSEKNNKQRLVRFVEIATALGKVPKVKIDKSLYDVSFIGLSFDKDEMEKRIHNRLLKRIKMGMIDEVKNLHKNGLSWKRMEELGLEYRYISRYLRGMISKEEMLEQLEKEIVQYSKRQMVWFKRNK